MLIFILSFVLLIIVVSIMSIGVMMGRKPISGSCGGLKTLGEDVVCEICGGKSGSCEENNATTSVKGERSQSVLPSECYDASVNQASHSTDVK